jgi:hypothetical protein
MAVSLALEAVIGLAPALVFVVLSIVGVAMLATSSVAALTPLQAVMWQARWIRRPHRRDAPVRGGRRR